MVFFIVLVDPELIWDVEIEEQKNLKPSGQDVRFRIAWASPSVMMMLIIGIWRYVCSIPWLSLSVSHSGCTTPHGPDVKVAYAILQCLPSEILIVGCTVSAKLQ